MQFEIRKKDPPRVAKFQAIIVLTNAPCSSRFYVFLQLITDGSPNKHQKKNKGRKRTGCQRIPAKKQYVNNFWI